jgi:hypothetical protein
MILALRQTAQLSAYVDGVSLIGPGLTGWPVAEPILRGLAPYQAEATVLPIPVKLPPAERRRAGRIIKLAIALGSEAACAADLDPKTLLCVFASSSGDGENCHEICQTLASGDRLLSPTRFHHSVHNVPAGYWSIAMNAMVASTAVSAHDGSFSVGLLEALTQVTVFGQPALLVAYDTGYPSPLNEKRPIPDALGVALALSPIRGPRSLAQIGACLSDGAADRLDNSQLEALRTQAPAGRALPLLVRLARREAGTTRIDYLAPTTLAVEVSPC